MKDRYGKRNSSNRFESLGSILDCSLKNMGLDTKLKDYQVITHWDDIVGKQISYVTKPLYFKFKTLFVSVANHIWMQQLTFLEDKIIQKVNDYVKHEVVKKIYYRLDQVDNKDSVWNNKSLQ